MSEKPNLLAEGTSDKLSTVDVSPLSKELVIGFVGYVGAGCSTAAKRLEVFLQQENYDVHLVKLSGLIENYSSTTPDNVVAHGIGAGPSRLERASKLQDLGDEIRKNHGHHAISSLAIQEIRRLRGPGQPGRRKIAFLLDSIKHHNEVELLRRVYDQSFRLVAVHCDRTNREHRLIGGKTSTAKYAGAPETKVLEYMERDEKDAGRRHGQQVRDAFYLADFFVDNNATSQSGEQLNDDLQRFVNLLLGLGLVRPTSDERAMYHAHAAALQSSCLSRQVGAALVSAEGTILSTGTNDVPKYGGGVYDENSEVDNRCFAWEWTDGAFKFVGCHNQRRKKLLRENIAEWLSSELAEELAEIAHPMSSNEMDTGAKARQQAAIAISNYFSNSASRMEELPGIKDIVEYSRSVHAEMNAVLSAARSGISPVGTRLFCTTYPCHNCARHLVTAGIEEVRFIEPYVKSLATELHSDAIITEPPSKQPSGKKAKATHMVISPFTGVGPRMFDDFFTKRSEMKTDDGTYLAPEGGLPAHAVRMLELDLVEEGAASLISGSDHG